MSPRRDTGFTLMEMVITIVLIGIVAGILAPVIKQATDAYVMSQSSANLQDKVRVATGRLSRELQSAAAPLIGTGANSITFTSTTVGGTYLSFNQNLPNVLPTDCGVIRNRTPSRLERFIPGEPIGTLCVLYPDNLGALSANERDALIIGRDLVAVSGISPQVNLVGGVDIYGGALWKIDFNADHSFSTASASAEQIFSLADYRHRISLSGRNLIWERVAASASNFSGASSGLLIDNVTAFTPSYDEQKGVVSISLTVEESEQGISVDEDIYVRN